jgi:hypothetical protein
MKKVRDRLARWFPNAEHGAIEVKRCYDAKGLAAYLLKGGDEAVRRTYLTPSQRRNWLAHQGGIFSKRIGVSQFLSKQVNAAAKQKALPRANRITNHVQPLGERNDYDHRCPEASRLENKIHAVHLGRRLQSR